MFKTWQAYCCCQKKLSYDSRTVIRKSHVTSRHISDIERGLISPSYDVLRSLIIALNISADTLFFPDYEETDPIFRELTACYRKCPESKRTALVQTVDFLIETILIDEK